MLLRKYLNLKNITFPESLDIPVFVVKYLRANRRTRSMKPKILVDSPSTRGKTK